MDPTDPNSTLIAGAPSAQQFSSLAPYMVPNTFAKLRAAMMQPAGVQPPPTAPSPEFGMLGSQMGYS
jgi:hypothetical protein